MSRRSTTSTPLRMELRALRADRSGRSNDGLPPGAYYMCSDSEHSSAASALPRTAESPTRSDETTNRRHANRVLTAALARNSQRQTSVPAHDTRSASTSSRKADLDADVENPTQVLRRTGRRQPSRRRRRALQASAGVIATRAPSATPGTAAIARCCHRRQTAENARGETAWRSNLLVLTLGCRRAPDRPRSRVRARERSRTRTHWRSRTRTHWRTHRRPHARTHV